VTATTPGCAKCSSPRPPRRLAVRCRDCQQLGPEDPLGSPALVGVDVRRLRANDRLVPGEQQTEPEDVRAAAVEHEVHLALRVGEPPQLAGRPLGPGVSSVGDRVPGVGLHDGAHDGGVRPGVVVAAETLSCCRHGHPFPPRAGQGVAVVFMPASLIHHTRLLAGWSASRHSLPSGEPASTMPQ